jgi:hypothetical protein
MSPPVEEGTLTLKDCNFHTLIDFIILCKVKEVKCEVHNHVDNNFSPNLVEQIHDRSVGDKIIRKSSISSDLLSNFPLHNEPNGLLKIVSYSLKENTKEVD